MKKSLFVLPCAAVLSLVFTGVFAPVPLHGQSAPSEKTEKDADKKEPDNAPIVKVSLYKNGFCFVTREIAPRVWDKPLVLTRSIAPRHGTLWFDYPTARLRRTTVEKLVTPEPTPAVKKNDAPGYRPDWNTMTDVFEWQQVTVRTKDGTKISGRVVGNQKPLPQEDARETPAYELMDELSAYRSSSMPVRITSSASTVKSHSPFGANFLTIETEDESFISVRQADVVEINAKSLYEGDDVPQQPAPKPVKQTEEIQIVEATMEDYRPVRMRYLTEGITWSPFYRLDLREEKGNEKADGRVAVSAAATVMNNYCDFENAEVEFISGFPSLDFASVVAAVAKKLPMSTFLQSLANPSAGTPNYIRNATSGILSQSVMSNIARPVVQIDKDDEPDAPPSKWSASGMEDVQYKSVGKLTMKKGDVLYLPIASEMTDFEYVTTWSAPLQGEFSFGEQTPDTNVWSTVRFRNPFDFALTTAPYEIERDGKILGQSTGSWFGAGELASVKITHALGVSCTMSHFESGNRERVFRIPRTEGLPELRYRYPDVTVELAFVNRTGKDVKLSVDSVFFGELIEADEKPAKSVMTTDRTMNSKNRLVWDIT
ncbi:MAG: hypothetical protein IKC53_00620, partial [Lentisphaeria bacterium]|nr:hypothetical protein [Lentisphaeria bacterium]